LPKPNRVFAEGADSFKTSLVRCGRTLSPPTSALATTSNSVSSHHYCWSVSYEFTRTSSSRGRKSKQQETIFSAIFIHRSKRGLCGEVEVNLVYNSTRHTSNNAVCFALCPPLGASLKMPARCHLRPLLHGGGCLQLPARSPRQLLKGSGGRDKSLFTIIYCLCPGSCCWRSHSTSARAASSTACRRRDAHSMAACSLIYVSLVHPSAWFNTPGTPSTCHVWWRLPCLHSHRGSRARPMWRASILEQL
jgi:hypothetical protein